MDIRRPRDRIWDNLRETERLKRYYSRRSRQLDLQHKWLTFPIAAIPVLAVVILQGEGQNRHLTASYMVIIAAILELALLHFGSGGDVKAAKIMGNQTTALAKQWRNLWFNQDRDDIMKWIEAMELLTDRAIDEPISHFKFRGKNYLDIKCAEEVNDVLVRKFGGQEAG